MADQTIYPSQLSRLYDRVAPVISEWWNPQQSVMSEQSVRAGALNDALYGAAQAVVPSQPADVLNIPMALATYSPEAEGAVFPKNIQYPSSVIKNIKKAFSDDPALANYAVREYGKVGDPLSKARIGQEEWQDYMENVLEGLLPPKKSPVYEASPKERSKLAQKLSMSRAYNQFDNSFFHRNNIETDTALGDAVMYGATDELEKALSRMTATVPDNLPSRIKRAMQPIETTLQRSGIDPKKLPIQTRIDKFNEIISKRSSNTENVLKDLTTSDGYNYIELTHPNDFRREGQRMGNSVGGYAEDAGYSLGGRKAIEEGIAKVISIRDKNGRPQINLEINLEDNTLVQAKKQGNGLNWNSKDTELLDNFLEKTGYNLGSHPYGFGSWQDLPKPIREKYQDRVINPKQDIDEYWGPGDERWEDVEPPRVDLTTQWRDEYERSLGTQDFMTQNEYILLRQAGDHASNYINNALPNESVQDFIYRTHDLPF